MSESTPVKKGQETGTSMILCFYPIHQNFPATDLNEKHKIIDVPNFT